MPRLVIPGRYAAEVEGPFVVFLIGMRVNRLLAFNKWIPTVMSMGPMLRTLYQHPEKGFLGGESFFYGRGVMLLQFWRSFEDLDRFARSQDEPHLAAWKRFNQQVGFAQGTVGVFHETYLVEAGQHEAVYVNMPVFGLAAATNHVKAVGSLATARRRLGGENDLAVPVEGAEVPAAKPER